MLFLCTLVCVYCIVKTSFALDDDRSTLQPVRVWLEYSTCEEPASVLRPS